jgi:multiple sugar transport system substrate-binding protein
MSYSKRLVTLVAVSFLAGACGSSATAAPPTVAQASATPQTSSGAAGGSASPGAGDTGPGPESGTVALTLSSGYSEMDPVYKKAADAYHALHPNVTITVSSTDLRSYEQKLTIALPTKTSTDIVEHSLAFLTPFVDQSLLAPVPAWMQSFVTSGVFDKFVQSHVTYKGQVWGVPEFVSAVALYYNKDYLSAANVQPPTTLDQIMAAAPLLTKYDANGAVSRSGLSFRLSGQGSGVAEKFWLWLMQYGTPQAPLGLLAQNSAGKYSASYANDSGVKVLEMYVNGVNKPPLIDDTKIGADTKAFEQGLTAMFMRESNVIGDIAANAPTLNYGAVKLPTTTLHSTESFDVSANSPHQQTAWDFIRFLMDLPQQQSIATISGWVPARIDLDYSALLAQQPAWGAMLVKDPNYQAGYQTDYLIPEWDEIETKLATHLVATYPDKSLVDNPTGAMQKLQQFADETNTILKAHNDFGQ